MAKNYRKVSIIVKAGEGRKAFFNPAGIAFDNKDGSINFSLHVLPGVQFHIGIPKVTNGDEKPDNPSSEDTPF